MSESMSKAISESMSKAISESMSESMTVEQMQLIKRRHNHLVNELYRVENLELFADYFSMYANFSEKYIEIPGNQTRSGHAEIIDW